MGSPMALASNMQGSVPVAIGSLTKRYNDAYSLAGFQVGLGKTIKTLALVAGGMVAIVSVLYMLTSSIPQQGMFGANPIGEAFGFIGTLCGVLGGGIGWVYGSSISAQGQTLKAALDTAVNTSPFLDNVERASMMSIPLQ